MPNLYIIGGCNGAGKTTVSYTVLPEILECKEFVNADSIAAGLSPFNPESVALEAGRLMLQRIELLMSEGVDFALETTLSTKSYVSLVKKAANANYKTTLLYFWLSSPEFAMQRVKDRVTRGGHNIPPDVIERWYYRGISNLIKLYILFWKEFLFLTGIAFLLAAPAGWWLMNNWLQHFTLRTEVNATVFLTAMAASVGIALLTVSHKAMTAALTNPVQSIQTE
ncbi:zeta toxin family protein [Chitinophaga sancti]|uniref:Predicted ABC-type ATPase n=1 Tax=Chitinophaga sancti TaxID=1004 RepID=A0A1K1Q980_9BACT|nr:zeta toxin family protein [Chitinophaga sancti]WQD61248.1 zeta toxin family protein [Chitinophaga sancti]WQG86625.1 zeta toxin family protein [Chitinophaga sancti]SFW56284.1 Predicted ABC-type ATPase [Chitinophaga sancti]